MGCLTRGADHAPGFRVPKSPMARATAHRSEGRIFAMSQTKINTTHFTTQARTLQRSLTAAGRRAGCYQRRSARTPCLVSVTMADDDEVDPLDAFMAEINTVVTKQKAVVAARPKDAAVAADKVRVHACCRHSVAAVRM